MPRQITILGNRIDCFPNHAFLYEHVTSALKEKNACCYITVNNVHTMMEGYRDNSFQSIINSGYLSLPDGKPLQIVGKLKGHKEIARLFGPTVMEKFIDWGRNDGLSHFFFGSSDETLTRLKAAIELQYPGTNIAGMLAPPFRPYTEWQNDVFIQLINNARPDVIWVGLGAPKQERWMYEHHKQIQCGMMFGIGAGFDYLAGNTRHAPAWMKNTSLEWLFRLVQEPGRLWKRYLSTIPHFVFFAGLELLGIRTKSSN